MITSSLRILFQVVFSVDGDSLVEKQTGDGFECTHVRQGAGDTLTMVRVLVKDSHLNMSPMSYLSYI